MISNLHLRQFRSYQDSTYEFDPGVNILVGPNASGKTNLLEAILVICRGKSYRALDKELIQHKKAWSRLDGAVEDSDRVVKIELTGEKTTKEFKIGGNILKRLPHNRTVPAVVFEPNHLQLLTQSPELRRGFLDDVIEQTRPAYSSLRQQYKRTLAQRNRLLKSSFLPDQIFVWNVRLSELGGQLAEQRQRFVNEHQRALSALYNALAGKKIKASMTYQTGLNQDSYATTMLKQLEARLAIDKERGFTTVGPHRDDLQLLIDGYPLIDSASRGETRTMMLALKLLEIQSVERARDSKPILLLDDVFSELDGARRRALTEYLRDYQTFITTTDADAVIEHFNDSRYNLIPTQHN